MPNANGTQSSEFDQTPMGSKQEAPKMREDGGWRVIVWPRGDWAGGGVEGQLGRTNKDRNGWIQTGRWPEGDRIQY